MAFGAVWVAWLGFHVQTGGDYPVTFAPPMNALLDGHLGAFFNLLPNDGAGGSVLLRAPGALALAIIDKPWALLAIAPTLLAAPHRRGRLGALAAAICAAWFGTAYVAAPGPFVHSLGGLSIVAHPQELWWPVAHLARDPTVTPGYYLPALITDHARELVIALMVPLSIPLARRRDRTASDCLALLALLLLLRSLLDPSNHVYYELPFVLALVAWEASWASAPLLSLLATGVLWLVFGPISWHQSETVQWLAYIAAMVPFIAVLARSAGIVPSRDCDRRRRGIPAVARA